MENRRNDKSQATNAKSHGLALDRFSIGLTPEEAIAMECMRGTAYLFRYGFSLEKSSSLEYAEQAISDLAARSPLLAVDS